MFVDFIDYSFELNKLKAVQQPKTLFSCPNTDCYYYFQQWQIMSLTEF